MLAAAAACLVFPLFRVTNTAWIYGGLLLASVWIAWHAVIMLRTQGGRLAFAQINVYALIVISLLSVSGLQS
jgi:hypothetical protein